MRCYSNIAEPDGTQGYLEITIPTQLLNGSLIVLFDDLPVDYASEVNATHSFAHFTASMPPHLNFSRLEHSMRAHCQNLATLGYLLSAPSALTHRWMDG